MSNRKGIVVANTVVTSATTDEYPVAEANDVLGGLHSAKTKTERNKIWRERRIEGMMCYVEADGMTYQLVGGITDDKWVPLDIGVAYMFEQGSPASAVWTIDHNLERYPESEVQVGDIWTEPTVDHTNKNRTILTFAFPVSGRAYLR